MNLSEIKSLDINISFQETKGQRHESPSVSNGNG